MTKQERLTEQLRSAIKGADKSVYAIAVEAKIDKSTLSRFLAGKGGLSMDGLDRLGKLLELRIEQTGKKPPKPKR